MLLRTLSALGLLVAVSFSSVAGAAPRRVTPVTQSQTQKAKASHVVKHRISVSKRRQPREGRPLIWKGKRHVHVTPMSPRPALRTLQVRK